VPEVGERCIAKTIILIRHAETNANNERRWQGSLDSGLSTLGLDQVSRLAQRFSEDPPSRVIASDLARTMATASAISADPTPDASWREFHVGAWEGLTSPQISEMFPGELEAFFAGDDVAPGGGELMSDFGARVVGAFDALVDSMGDGERVFVVTHGGVIWTLLSRFLGDSSRRSPISISFNTAVSVVTVSGSEPPQITVFNDATHLDDTVTHFGPEGPLATLIRHGETEGNLLGRWQGHSDSPLSPDGRRQVQATASHLPAMDHLFTSPLGRARQTADILAAPLGVDPLPDDGFKEMGFGAWEDLTPAEARSAEPDVFRKIYELGMDLPRGGDGETFAAAGERMSKALSVAVGASTGDIGVVSHGAAIRAYVVNMMDLTFEDRDRFPVPRNASLSSVRYSEPNPILVSYNVAPHMGL